MLKKAVLLVVVLIGAGVARAQHNDWDSRHGVNKIYVGIEGTLLSNFSRFSGNGYVDNGLRKPPLVTGTLGLSFRQNVASRFSLETGASLIRLGYKTTFTSNYQGGKRWQNQWSSAASFSVFGFPIRINYHLDAKSKRFRKYVSLGTYLVYNPNFDLTANVASKGRFIDPYTGDTFTFTYERQPSPRFTLNALVGIGVERELGKRIIANLGIVYSKGFTNIGVWNTEYTTWDVGQDVDSITFNNTIVNKGSYLGLRLAFLLSGL